MFCSKCGNQLPENAFFCPNCGTKTLIEGAEQHEIINEETNNSQIGSDDFKEYVNAHVRKTTEFQSAQELIRNSKPWDFMKKPVCICALIGLIMGIIEGNLGYTFLLGILGAGIVFCVGPMIVNSKYEKQFSAKINMDSDIDIANLCEFLTKNLCKIDPSFREWSLVENRGLIPYVENKIANEAKEVTIGCEFGVKRTNLAEITIRNYPENRAYHISAGYNGFLLNYQMEPMFARSCLIKTAPILQAAMEYYINCSTSSQA